LKSGGQESLGHDYHASGAGDEDAGGDSTDGGGMFGIAGRGGLATNYVSYCSCTVRTTRVELMLLSKTCCFSM